jgi:cytochrome b involved in lipid metabolism
MGWLKWNGNRQSIATLGNSHVGPASLQTVKNDTLLVENVQSISSGIEADATHEYPFQATSLSNDKLPYIPSQVVEAAKSDPNRLWIVIDQVVFDCTEFASIHPGGHTVIESFHGEDCSWQFWRFHSPSNMDTDGRPLRIGRTAGVANCFKERPRFVGLRRFGGDEAW